MELLYELENQADEFITERLRRTISDALLRYNPMRERVRWRDALHHCYERTLSGQVWRTETGRPCVSRRRLRRDERRHECNRQMSDAKALFQKNTR